MSKRKTNSTPPRERRVWMTLAGDFKKSGAALLHQQCWCFGFDIRRIVNGERANLLLEMGFERTPPPNGKLGATMYQRRESSGELVTLWGFGMCFGDHNGGAFISRFAFWPRIGPSAAPEAAFSPTHLDAFRAPRRLEECQAALDYFGRALHWLAEYEREVAQLAGDSHRNEALRAWHHTVSKSNQTANRWDELALQSCQVARFWMRENNTTRELPRA
ncbi:hypothetical protein EON83_06405 [bacterium]|nr:MAG: hypothetical protein EON83_06405 [bacterium]